MRGAGLVPDRDETAARVRQGLLAAEDRRGVRRPCRARPGEPSALRREHPVFETDAGDGFGESGFSKERRLEPQITIGLLTGAGGFPLMVSAFEGNRAETKTMLPAGSRQVGLVPLSAQGGSHFSMKIS